MLRSMVLREREGGGEVGVVRKKKEKYICIGIHESNWCVCVGGGGGVGGVTVLRMMCKQQNCHSNACRSVDCCAYIFHRFFFKFQLFILSPMNAAR